MSVRLDPVGALQLAALPRLAAEPLKRRRGSRTRECSTARFCGTPGSSFDISHMAGGVIRTELSRNGEAQGSEPQPTETPGPISSPKETTQEPNDTNKRRVPCSPGATGASASAFRVPLAFRPCFSPLSLRSVIHDSPVYQEAGDSVNRLEQEAASQASRAPAECPWHPATGSPARRAAIHQPVGNAPGTVLPPSSVAL